MSDLNLVVLTGRLARDIELKTTQNGTTLCNCSIAVGTKKKVGNNWEDVTNWVNLTMFGRTAELANEYTRKGSHIRVTGSLSVRSYEKDGQKRTSTDVIVNELQFLGGGKPQQPQQQPQQNNNQMPFDDDLPF